MSKKLTRGESVFLNKTGFHSVASAAYCFDVDTEYRPYGSGSLWINDCSRVITLDVGFSDEDEYYNSLHKLKSLKALLEQAEKDIVKSREDYLRVTKEYKRKEKKKKEKTAS